MSKPGPSSDCSCFASAAWARRLPETQVHQVGDTWIYVLHDVNELDLTVIIPTIPERRDLFNEALGSVLLQTVPPRYLTAVDARHNGPVETVNALADTIDAAIMPDGRTAVVTSFLSRRATFVDLTTTPVTNLGSIRFDQVAGVGNNQPDSFGGGEAIYGNVLPVGLRAAGNVALVNSANLELRTIVNLDPPAPFNPMTCGPVGLPTGAGGCAVHGVTPRPREKH